MKKNKILRELLMGIILLGVALQIICIVISKDYLYNAVGLWTGIAVACFMAIHIKRSIEDELELGEEGAVKHARNAYATRTAVTLVIIGIVICLNLGNPITLVIGIFPLKISAYLQPYIHKLYQRFDERKKKEMVEGGSDK